MIVIEDVSHDDVGDLMRFIDDNWKKNHVFVTNQNLFDFQHKDKDKYNFLIAKDTDSKAIMGVLGYIPLSHYDKQLENHGNVWGAIWKTSDEAQFGLGMDMLNELRNRYKSYGAIGLSAAAVKIYKILKFNSGVVNQYYIPNPEIGEFQIARIVDRGAKPVGKPELTMTMVDSLDHIGDFEGYYAPTKTVRYLINRYQNHPFYKYVFHIVSAEDGIKLILVSRTILVGEAKCSRIVDVLGNLKEAEGLGYLLSEYIVRENMEYIDILNYGIDEQVFSELGFLKLDVDGDTIIPNYFEPFTKENIALHCAHNSTEPNYVFFKGDADQDRPNII